MVNHIRFLRKFDYDIPGTNGWSTRSFKAGSTHTVTRDVAAKAIAAGAAEEITPPKKAVSSEVASGSASDKRG